VNTRPYVTFFHAPQSRSGATRILFEELGVDHDMHVLDLKAGTQRDPAYLAINPMGKVPAIRHGEALVTEQPAIMTYLADLYPDKGLAPPPGDMLRGPYLRWMVFYGSCLEPAVMDHSARREAMPETQCGYGSFDSVIAVLSAQLATGPYLLGERFTAADVLYGSALHWFLTWKLVPDLPEFRAYVDRVCTRPAFQRAEAADEALAASQSG
jgi:glutathione S-transferase